MNTPSHNATCDQATCHKISIEKNGGYEELRFISTNIPLPKPGEALIKVEACGVNYADCVIRWGLYESANKLVGKPITPGFEFAGKILSVNSSSDEENSNSNSNSNSSEQWEVGDDVFGISFFGAYTTHLCVPLHQIYRRPTFLTVSEAAGIPAVFLTAYHALFQNIILRPGMNYLVHSAAGGVGGALLQLIQQTQPQRVVAVVGSTHKVEMAKKLGASDVIDKSAAAEDLWKKAREYLPAEARGYDVILDANGATTLKQSYDHLAPKGKLVCYGFHSMFPKKGGRVNYFQLIKSFLQTPRFNPIHMTSANKSIITFNLSFLFDRHDLINEGMNSIINLLEEKKIVPPQVTTFPLKEAGLAHQLLESGKSVGKIVLVNF